MKRVVLLILVLTVASAFPHFNDDDEEDDASIWQSPAKSWSSKLPNEFSHKSSRADKLKQKKFWKKDHDDDDDDSDVGDGAIVLFEKDTKRKSLRTRKNLKNRKTRKSLITKTSGNHFSGQSPRLYDRGYDEFPFNNGMNMEQYHGGYHGYGEDFDDHGFDDDYHRGFGRDFDDYGYEHGRHTGFGRDFEDYRYGNGYHGGFGKDFNGFENRHNFPGNPYLGIEYGPEPYEGLGYGRDEYDMGYNYEPYGNDYNSGYLDYEYDDYYQPRHQMFGGNRLHNEFDYPMGRDYFNQNNFFDRGNSAGYNDVAYPMNEFHGRFDPYQQHNGYGNFMHNNFY